MKSPADKDTIQIDITNACIFQCANCTRLCGHHKKPFFMDFGLFKKAVDSLDEYPFKVGIMGGEPTLHPDFESFSRYIAEKRGCQGGYDLARKPTKSFVSSRGGNRVLNPTKIGLWTSLGQKYYDHFETIQDVYEFQAINDHMNPGVHQALLITRKELGIDDEKWLELRDNCWVQNFWSASITPKGAFFCEVAATLDMLFDGPGGWPLEPGWWKRQPCDFKDQLHWCEMCSAALDVPVIQGNSEIDILSPLMLKKLEDIGSPKLKRKKYIVVNPSEIFKGKTSDVYEKDGPWNLPNNDNSYRISNMNKSLLPRKLSVLLPEGRAKPKPELPEGCVMDFANFEKLQFEDWAVILRGNAKFGMADMNAISTTVFNPGCAYYLIPKFNSERGTGALSAEEIWDRSDIILLNRRASSLRGIERVPAGPALLKLYPPGKTIHMDGYPRFDEQGALKAAWLKVRQRILSPAKQKCLKALRRLREPSLW